jgi:hypothetical protein
MKLCASHLGHHVLILAGAHFGALGRIAQITGATSAVIELEDGSRAYVDTSWLAAYDYSEFESLWADLEALVPAGSEITLRRAGHDYGPKCAYWAEVAEPDGDAPLAFSYGDNPAGALRGVKEAFEKYLEAERRCAAKAQAQAQP